MWSIKNTSRNELHGATENFKESYGGGDSNEGGDETVWGQEDEVKETVEKWNEESAYHDGDDGEKEAGAKSV